MKDMGITIAKSILLLAAGVLVGTSLLMLAYMLPVDVRNRNTSYETLNQERWYPRVTVAGYYSEDYFHSWLPDVLDDTTDRIILHTALDDRKGNPLVSAMESYSDYMGSYPYYWHGYVSVLRPAMLLFDYTELRVVSSIGQTVLLLALAFLIGREKGIRYVAMLLTSYVLLMPAAVSMSLQFTWVFYIALIGTLVLLKKRGFFSEKGRYVFFFLILGMLTSYFDLLTYPLVTWGIPLIWWLVTDGSDREERFWVGRVIRSGFGWIAGYAGMWAMKWALASAVLHQDVFESAMNEVFFRSGTLEGEVYSLAARCEALYVNWKHYEYKVFGMILAVWLVWWVCRTVLNGGWRRDSKRRALLLTGASSVVWYFVLANHTQIHHFFTYRIFSVSVLAFLATALCSVPRMGEAETVPPKRRLAVCGACLAAGLLSIPPVFLAREDITAANDYEVFRQIPMNDGDCFEVEFTPTFDRIRDLCLGLESERDEGERDESEENEGEEVKGYCEIEIRDADGVKYQTAVRLKDFEGDLQSLSMDMELDHNSTYRVVCRVKDNDRPVLLWVTESGSMPLKEYGALSVNGQTVQGQMMTDITYRTLPPSRKTLIFLAMTWLGVFLVCGYAFWPRTGEGGLLSVGMPSGAK